MENQPPNQPDDIGIPGLHPVNPNPYIHNAPTLGVETLGQPHLGFY